MNFSFSGFSLGTTFAASFGCWAETPAGVAFRATRPASNAMAPTSDQSLILREYMAYLRRLPTYYLNSDNVVQLSSAYPL